MKWYYQVAHHPIWDYDMSSPPLLVDITVDGKPIKAVAVPSKQVVLYMFDRITGKPMWPINEKPVHASDVPAKRPPRPSPSRQAAPYWRQSITERTWSTTRRRLKAEAQDIVKKYTRSAPMFPRRGFQSQWRLSDRDRQWHRRRRQHQLAGRRLRSGNPGRILAGAESRHPMFGLVPLPEGLSDLKYDEGIGGQVFRIKGGPASVLLGRAQGQRRRSGAGRGASCPSADARSGPPRRVTSRASRWASRLTAPSPPSTWTKGRSPGRWPMAHAG